MANIANRTRRTLVGAAGAGSSAAAVAGLSSASTLVFLLPPDAVPGVQLAVFALMSGVTATGALAPAARGKRRAGPRTIPTIEENP
jgi:hypothetical protein